MFGGGLLDKLQARFDIEITNRVKGLEKEAAEKRQKYQKVFEKELENGDDITFTGMYKYVDSGLTDKFNLPIFKRKRIFRRVKQVKKQLTDMQKEEI